MGQGVVGGLTVPFDWPLMRICPEACAILAGWGLRGLGVVLAAEHLGVDECQPDRAGRDPLGDEQAAVDGEARGRRFRGRV